VAAYRLLAIGVAAAFVLCGIAAVVMAHSGSLLTDFLSFWAAGHLAVGGHPTAAYNIAQHLAVEEQVISNVGILPFPYPPPFLLILLPFGLAPFWIAFAAWIAMTSAFYVVVSRRIIEPRFSLAQAAAAANFITGQNGFLTSGIFIAGTNLLAARPVVGGAILGTLCFKPQLAILLPVALLAGREWRAIAGGIISSAVLVVLALLLFGMDSYRGFLALLPQFSDWLRAERWPLGEMASTFAMLRSVGVPAGPALAVHTAIALVAAGLTARAWALRLDTRVPVLAAATLLVTPYLMTYDALLLTVPLGYLLGERHGRAKFLATWALSLIPVLSYFSKVPNTLPIAAMLALWALHSPSAGWARTKAAYQV